MQLGFCLFKYFPFGGLQRDFLRIANECHTRGHSIRVYCSQWEGAKPEHFQIIKVPQKGISSPAKNRSFVKFLTHHIRNHPIDYLIGFNKIPGLDCYYAADGCFLAKAKEQRSSYYRFSQRFKHFFAYENAIFAEGEKTHILMISKPQLAIYQHLYNTEPERFHLLPPGVARDRVAPDNAPQQRKAFRMKYDIAEDDWLWLMVGSGFKTKGVDRSLRALSALPAHLRNKTKLFIVGQDNPRSFLKMARQLSIQSNIHFFQGRDDIPEFLLGADILIHPAYNENTGTVLLEALVSGLPVLVTDNCGYADYIQQADAGLLIPNPFNQKTMDQQVQRMMNRQLISRWQNNALTFAKDADLYSMPEAATDIIETLCKKQCGKT